jgi:Asp-tRNA(Asn)/Glu-tRNA(Gln) amidotransferase A subunit family amidase
LGEISLHIGHFLLFDRGAHPAMVLPFTLDSAGLPIAIQLVRRCWTESRLRVIAKTLSNITGEFPRPPAC